MLGFLLLCFNDFVVLSLAFEIKFWIFFCCLTDKFVCLMGTNVSRKKAWIFLRNFGTCCGSMILWCNDFVVISLVFGCKVLSFNIILMFFRIISENSGADSNVLSCKVVLQLRNGI